MRTSISIDDHKLSALLEATGTRNMTKALNLAVDHYLRQKALRDLRALRGQVNILDNDSLEHADIDEYT
jgi:Arc/MetJ family transcription regulator